MSIYRTIPDAEKTEKVESASHEIMIVQHDNKRTYTQEDSYQIDECLQSSVS